MSASSDPKLFAQVQEGINKHCPGMIVQFSTGGRGATRRRVAEHRVSARHGLPFDRFGELSDHRLREPPERWWRSGG